MESALTFLNDTHDYCTERRSAMAQLAQTTQEYSVCLAVNA